MKKRKEKWKKKNEKKKKEEKHNFAMTFSMSSFLLRNTCIEDAENVYQDNNIFTGLGNKVIDLYSNFLAIEENSNNIVTYLRCHSLVRVSQDFFPLVFADRSKRAFTMLLLVSSTSYG